MHVALSGCFRILLLLSFKVHYKHILIFVMPQSLTIFTGIQALALKYNNIRVIATILPDGCLRTPR